MTNSTPTIIFNRITENSSKKCGSGLYCRASSAVIYGNRITGNTTGGCGGGIACSLGTEATILDNFIAHNDAADTGGGIACFRANPDIANNIIVYNRSNLGGGGIDCWRESSPTITHNTISENFATYGGGGISCHERCFPKVVNTILWNNAAAMGNEVWAGTAAEPSFLSISHSNISGGLAAAHFETGSGFVIGQGIIDVDPLFVDVGADDFHLTIDSPCINAGGFGTGIELPARDFEGDDRVVFGRADIGADEAALHLYYRAQAVPGGEISVGCIGLPGMGVVLALGSGKKQDPLKTQWGEFYLNGPYFYTLIGYIPANGALVNTYTIPQNWIPGKKYPFQALCGGLTWIDPLLTNLMMVVVE